MLQLHLQVRMQVLFTLQLTYMSFLELKYSYTSMLQVFAVREGLAWFVAPVRSPLN